MRRIEKDSPGWENMAGADQWSCPCGSAMDHWENFSGAEEWPDHCANKDCGNPPTLAAHVYKGDRRQYIAPLCDSCRKLSSFTIRKGAYLAEANKSLTCERGKKK
ncbi:MAG: hypothetical protein LBC90_07180 [Candidatus Adiutrix sp.]|jgi:hypothetical protein|nr:hypothetical protein [Candidatus Adiutrix sp.]